MTEKQFDRDCEIAAEQEERRLLEYIECAHCGKPIEPTGGQLYAWTHCDPDQWQCFRAEP